MPTTPHLAALFTRPPKGWSEMTYLGRRYGVTRTVLANGRIQKLYAEELGGANVISANLYDGENLRPCEMPASKVVEFLAGASLSIPR